MATHETRFTPSPDTPVSVRHANERRNRASPAVLAMLVSAVLVALISLAAPVNAPEASGVNEAMPVQITPHVEYLPSAYAKEEAQAPVVKEHIQAF